MKRRKFFTMIELLAAVALMVLLAGIGFAGYSYAMNSAKESATKSLIARIGAGLEAVRAKHGFFPVCNSFDKVEINFATNGLADTVTFYPSASDSAKKTVWSQTDPDKKQFLKTFLEVIDAETLKKYVNKQTNVLEDAWGGTVYYCYPGKVNKEKFDLVAPGTDGTFGTANAAVPSNSLADYQNSGNEWACDDIANFQ